DCAGLPECVLAELGVLPAGYRVRRNYGRLPSKELAETLGKWCTPVSSVSPGVLIRIRFPKQAEPGHLAIVTGPTIIHAYRPERRRGPRRERLGVVEMAYRTRWVDMTVDAWRAPGVSYE